MANTTNTPAPVTGGWRESKPVKFILETGVELKKTQWPTKEELRKSTTLVIVTILAVGVYIGGLDAILRLVTSRFIGW